MARPFWEAIQNALTDGGYDREEALLSQNEQAANDITLPTQDELTGGTAGYHTLSGTAFDNISTDPRYRAAQNEALSGIQNVVRSGGITAQDRLRMAQSEQERRANERSIQQTAAANARARGVRGSGVDEARAAIQSQGAADDANMRDLQMNALAMERTLGATRDLANMGMGMQGQEFGEGAARASARDVVNRFNAENMTSTDRFNIGQRANAAQTGFQNRMARFGAQQGARDARRGYVRDRNQGNLQGWADAANTVGQFASGVIGGPAGASLWQGAGNMMRNSGARANNSNDGGYYQGGVYRNPRLEAAARNG